MLQVDWVKSQANTWLELETFDLSTVQTKMGVYIIWNVGNPSRVVRVGQGDIADRLGCHRRDREVLAHRGGGLRVTWAAVPAAQVNGVERFLANEWNPLVGDAFPQALPIAVNSPFA